MVYPIQQNDYKPTSDVLHQHGGTHPRAGPLDQYTGCRNADVDRAVHHLHGGNPCHHGLASEIPTLTKIFHT